MRCGIEPGKRQRHAAAHRAAGDRRLRPSDVVEQLGEIVGEQFRRVAPSPAIGLAVAAAVVGEHFGVRLEPLDDAVPDAAVERQRMDEDQPRRTCVRS